MPGRNALEIGPASRALEGQPPDVRVRHAIRSAKRSHLSAKGQAVPAGRHRSGRGLRAS